VLTIFKKKQNTNQLGLETNYILDSYEEKNLKIQNKLEKKEYNNLIYYPSSSKEWFSSVYSYNKSYIKLLIVWDLISNKASILLRGYDKANPQYTLINSKTRNGTFGLKGWLSSHLFIQYIHVNVHILCYNVIKGCVLLGILSYRYLIDHMANELPKPHTFSYLELHSSAPPYLGWDTPTELRGRYTNWRTIGPNMSVEEKVVHLEQDLDYYRDLLQTNPNSGAQRHIDALLQEISITRGLAPRHSETQQQMDIQRQLQQAPQAVPQATPQSTVPQAPQAVPQATPQSTVPQATPQTPVPQSTPQTQPRHPSGWTPVNFGAVGFVTPRILTVSFLKKIILYIIPLLNIIMAFLFITFILNITPYIYSILNTILGQHITLAVEVLFLVILYLVKLLLMIRRANKSYGIYDKLFIFVGNHYSSGILYFCILLLSVGLVYLCGCDCNSVFHCNGGCTISCAVPLVDIISWCF
jgi:hypothetical protein